MHYSLWNWQRCTQLTWMEVSGCWERVKRHGPKGHGLKRHGRKGQGLKVHGHKGHGLKGHGHKGQGLKGHGLKGHGLKGQGLKRHGRTGQGLKGQGLKGHGLKGHGTLTSFNVTLWPMMLHRNSKFGYNRFSSWEDFIQVNKILLKFWIFALAVTLTLKTANQFFCMTLRLTIHHYTKVCYKKLNGSGDIFWKKSRHEGRRTQMFSRTHRHSESNIPCPSPSMLGGRGGRE